MHNIACLQRLSSFFLRFWILRRNKCQASIFGPRQSPCGLAAFVRGGTENYTGNVRDADGRRFGYQVTFFRVGIDHTPANPSKWAIRDLYMTHLAISDAKGQRYRYAEKLSRGGPGLAGAKSDSYQVWNEDWF